MSHSPIVGKKGGKNFSTGGVTPRKSKPAGSFAKKGKRNPASQDPGKNTKNFTKTKAATSDQVQKTSQRDARSVPAPIQPNQADVALQQIMRPRKSFNRA